jgi:hypothetical protein
MHIGATKPYKHQGVIRQPGEGVGTVERREGVYYYRLKIDGAVMSLGAWWMRAARKGTVAVLPIVNVNPTFEHPPRRGRGESLDGKGGIGGGGGGGGWWGGRGRGGGAGEGRWTADGTSPK